MNTNKSNITPEQEARIQKVLSTLTYLNEYHKKNSEAALRYLAEQEKYPLDIETVLEQHLRTCR